jgi:hypothetical protein
MWTGALVGGTSTSDASSMLPVCWIAVTMRLYRQRKRGHWDEVVRRVRATLKQRLK